MDDVTFSTSIDYSTEPSGNYKNTSGSLVLLMASLTLATAIISANSLTIYVIRKTEALQTLSNMYILSLAHADLMVGLGLLPTASFFVSYIKREYFDRYIRLCVFMNSFIIGSAFVSILHLMIISIDRCLYIKAPYFYTKNFNKTRIHAFIGFIWILGAFYSCLPQLLLSKDIMSYSKCDTTYVMPIEYIFYSNCTVFFSSVTLTFVMYGIILNIATKHRRKINALHVPSQRNALGEDGIFVVSPSGNFRKPSPSEFRNKSASSTKDNSVGCGQVISLLSRNDKYEETPSRAEIEKELQNLDKAAHTSNAPNQLMYQRIETRSLSLQNSMKNIKFFATVFGVFVACWAPSMVCMPLDYYVTIPRSIYNTATLLALSNSAANFIIFCWLSPTFRKAVDKTVRRPTCHRN